MRTASAASSAILTDTSAPVLYGAIEGGVTKFVCAVGHSPTDLLESITVPTTDADPTLASCVRFFREAEARHGRIDAFGINCFGPIELDTDVGAAALAELCLGAGRGLASLASVRFTATVSKVSPAVLPSWRDGLRRSLSCLPITRLARSSRDISGRWWPRSL